jgi:TPR repeat protein
MNKNGRFGSGLVIFITLLFYNMAWSGTTDYRECVSALQNDHYQKTVLVCGQAIDDGGLNNEQMAALYAARATAYNYLRLEAEENGNDAKGEKFARLALGDFDRAIEFDADEYSHYFGRGTVFEFTKNYKKAILDYRRAMELGDQNTSTITVQGNTVDFQQFWQNQRARIEERLDRTEEKFLALPQRPKIKMYFLEHEDQKIYEQALAANWEGNNEQAYQLMRQCADSGHPQCIWATGLMHVWGRGVAKDNEEAVQWFEKAIQAGYTHGMIELGNMYRDGDDLDKDTDRAVSWYQKAVAAGELDGKVAEGLLHFYGEGVEKDESRGMALIQEAARAGNAWGQNVMGLAHQAGRGVDKDPAAAVRWYRKAAKQGNSDAQLNLALAYTFGKGVLQDPKRAVHWYELAAVQGETQAMFNLGVSYHNGTGVSRNSKKARVWWRRAAQLGHKQAQKVLGGQWN